jgi:acyl-CoA thioester hydrolase
MIDITYFANKKNAERASEPKVKSLPVNPAEFVVTFRGVVYPWHLDHMTHMNVQHYVSMFDQASWVLLALLGLDSGYFQDKRRGMATLEQTIQYKSELRSGDMVEIRSTVLELRDKTIRLLHNMHKAGTGALAASTTILGVHIDSEARKSAPLPEEVRERVQVLGASRNFVAEPAAVC